MSREQWFDLRFTEDSKKIKCACIVCGRSMFFPKSKAGKYTTCGGECAKKRRELQVKARERVCLTCEKVFYPRLAQIKNGGGKYCCNACAAPTRGTGRTQEAHEKRAEVMRQLRERGLIKYVKGAEHPLWKGGKAAYLLRTREKRNAKRRLYLRKNAERAREWTKKRLGRMIKPLPKGTVKKIGSLQRWKCAVCGACISGNYHVDHVVPLSKGGEHDPKNLQLLCPTCNLNKSSKDPIDFMQSKGFLI